ncbi:Gp138 family membrane-puncturing spike protein [Klebsiella pneumoniae]|uniref:Gp138 family membrane-puncturing spike protein n=1 Tax=Klebsiella pneumoniae TaxID=573 RepID=UPI002964B5B2|nr:Gp138 family membrane-puncturing spike protein [Klebsiella pneumoniae]MDW1476512.1 Gp138 family membrane-puncturing spike protein [Klebsiella pneumoniae]
MATARPIEDREVYDSILKGAKQSIRVSMPGVIKSFDPETVTCVVEVSIYIPKPESAEGKSIDRLAQDNVFYPLILDAPVIFPRGGGCTLTFPISAGDECLVIFADRCIDFWWQNGGVQNGSRGRMHDYSDAFVIPGPQSQAKKISGISTTAAQLRTDDGTAFIEVSAGGDITATTAGNATINAPEIVLNGNVTINGNLSQGMGESGGTATMHGPVTVTNDVTAGGKSLMTHTHGGVETGSGNTGEPQ